MLPLWHLLHGESRFARTLSADGAWLLSPGKAHTAPTHPALPTCICGNPAQPCVPGTPEMSCMREIPDPTDAVLSRGSLSGSMEKELEELEAAG